MAEADQHFQFLTSDQLTMQRRLFHLQSAHVLGLASLFVFLPIAVLKYSDKKTGVGGWYFSSQFKAQSILLGNQVYMDLKQGHIIFIIRNRKQYMACLTGSLYRVSYRVLSLGIAGQ